MKKYLALTMAACMALSLAACGSSASSTTSSSAAASTEATSDSAATAEATGSDNITGIAQCCDVGTLDDESFNQGCWEAVKGYGDENGIEYNYYLPSGEDASDEDRETLIRQAVAEAQTPSYALVTCMVLLWPGLPPSILMFTSSQLM